MKPEETYNELKEGKVGLYKEKGSKFIAYAYPVYCEKEIKARLVEVKKNEYSARHHCYAYKLHTNKSSHRANDDGEPSFTAGKPILGQIISNKLTNTLIIVARYFGGVKLGVPGLINAYKMAAYDAISKATIITKTIKVEYEVNFKYPQINYVMRIVKEHDLEIIDTNFKIECKLTFAVAKNRAERILNLFQKNHNLTIQNL